MLLKGTCPNVFFIFCCILGSLWYKFEMFPHRLRYYQLSSSWFAISGQAESFSSWGLTEGSGSLTCYWKVLVPMCSLSLPPHLFLSPSIYPFLIILAPLPFSLCPPFCISFSNSEMSIPTPLYSFCCGGLPHQRSTIMCPTDHGLIYQYLGGRPSLSPCPLFLRHLSL